MEISKDTTVGEIVNNYSNAAEVLSGFGMHCCSCPISQMETIEEASSVHGIETEFMIKKLNEDLKPIDKK